MWVQARVGDDQHRTTILGSMLWGKRQADSAEQVRNGSYARVIPTQGKGAGLSCSPHLPTVGYVPSAPLPRPGRGWNIGTSNSDSKGKAVPVAQGWSSEEIQVLADGSKDTRYLVRALTVSPIISI